MRSARPPFGQLPEHPDDPFRRLYAAQRSITSDLTLTTMTSRIVESACEVVGVRSAVLAVLSPAGGVEQVVQIGLAEATAERLRRAGTPEEVARCLNSGPGFIDVRAQPRGRRPAQVAGAGPAHYLSAAITAGDDHYADLYVMQPLSGAFTDAHHELIDALSRTAGTAIAHARSFDRERRSTEWLFASGEVARALLAGADIDMLGEIVQRAVSAAGAHYGQLVIPTHDDRLKIIATSGLGAADLLDTVHEPGSSGLGTAVIEGRPLRIPDVTPLLGPSYDNRHAYGPAMVTPLIDALGIRGSLMLARVQGSPTFAPHELELFSTYAAQVALAMQFADARLDAERLQLLDTRHQVAREVHDVVMQRLFATGVGLETLLNQLSDCEQAGQLRRYVKELDETIDEIRERVFGTRGDAQAVLPSITRFPRVASNAVRDAAGSARGTGAAVLRSVTSPKQRRGRRRSDWVDGDGTQRS